MSVENTVFTSILLKRARRAIKAAGIRVGKLSTWKSALGGNTWFEVWEDHKSYAVWSGNASSAAEAKVNYLSGLLPEGGDE